MKILFCSSSVIPPKRVTIYTVWALLDRLYSIICGTDIFDCFFVLVCLTYLYLKKLLGVKENTKSYSLLFKYKSCQLLSKTQHCLN